MRFAAETVGKVLASAMVAGKLTNLTFKETTCEGGVFIFFLKHSFKQYERQENPYANYGKMSAS